MGAGVWARFHPQHQDIPVIRAETAVALTATAIGLLATLFASVAVEAGRRMAASLIVLGCWSLVLIGGSLVVGLTPPGPQSYARYAGARLFHVPWQYYPRGADDPNGSGFLVSVCLDTLLGTYDDACNDASRITIRPSEHGFDSWDERIWQWRSQLRQVTSYSAREGYQVSDTPEARYYRRSDADGNLDRLVICSRTGCRRQFLANKLVIDYPLPAPEGGTGALAPDGGLSQWDEVDQKLLAVIMRWEARRTNAGE